MMAARKRASGSARGARRMVGQTAGTEHARQAYNGAVRSQLADLQRARIVSAMFDVVSERGAGSVSVAHIVERAGVSRRTFYELFDDREECLLAAFEQALVYTTERILPAFESQNGWREQVRAGLVELLAFLDEEPVIGRLLVVESLAGGPATQARHAQIVDVLIGIVEQGREHAKASVTPPPLAGEGVVGGVLTVIHSRLVENKRGLLIELTGALMSMIVLPYLGSTAARRELERPAPKVAGERSEREPLSGDPFKEAGMRLTYRTVRVLVAIAEHPGASNRLIGDAAEITDQGQISKLLGRLQGTGMVTNTGLGPGQGAPNAWTLTPQGRQVVSTIRSHTEGRTPKDSE